MGELEEEEKKKKKENGERNQSPQDIIASEFSLTSSFYLPFSHPSSKPPCLALSPFLIVRD